MNRWEGMKVMIKVRITLTNVAKKKEEKKGEEMKQVQKRAVGE